ncbi:MAG: hypothetical protein ACI4OK_04925 [Selenomonas bovis]
MESMDKVIDTIMDKKKGYDYDGDDFAAPTELMVSITLHEYRNLVASNARIREENSKLTIENNKLKKECTQLKEDAGNGAAPADINAIVISVLKAMDEKKG